MKISPQKHSHVDFSVGKRTLAFTASIGAIATVLMCTAPGMAIAQDNAATAAPTEADSETVVVVKGYRNSLKSAQQIKRTSDAIVDAIVSEDIGKLPDNNASEALARVPGIQVNRYNDEAGDVLIRGLPNVATSFNGREFFTTNDRSLHMQDFPAGVIAGIEVYKSGTPELLEPGLGGLINLRSRRPFDVKDTQIAGEIRGSYNDQSEEFDPSANLLLTKRWNTSAGEVGALINFSYTRMTYRNADRYADSAVLDPNGWNPSNPIQVTTPGVGMFRFPANAGNFYEKGVRERPGINGTLQWRPKENLEFYAEGLWQAYRGDVITDAFNVNFERPDLNGVTPTLSNVVLVQGEPLKAASFTKTGGYVPEFWRRSSDASTNTYQGAVGFKWTKGRAILSGDLAYTWSKYEEDKDNIDAQLSTAPTINVQFDVGGTAIFNLGDFNAGDPNNYVFRGYYQNDYVEAGQGVQGRLDLDLETNSTWLTKIKVGIRGSNRTSMAQTNDRYVYTAGLNIPLASLPTGALELISDGYGDDEQQFRNWMMPTFDAMRDKAEALRQFSYAQTGQANFATAEIPYNPLNGFRSREASYAAYVQGKFEFDLGQYPVDGNIGVRVVKTEGRYRANSNIVSGGVPAIVPTVTDQTYTDVLPSISARLKISPELQLRLAVNKTRSRPSFWQLNPSMNITVTTPPLDGSTPHYGATGNAGNPDLKPLTSINYDASIEYYFAESSSATLAVFYHDLEGFVNNYTRDVQDPTYGLVQFNRPENAGKGRIKGFEANYQTFFTFLPDFWSGFGVQANVTYLDGTNQLPRVLGEADRQVQIPGLSKWTYNLTGFYEKDGFSARLSYNSRSEYVNDYNRNTNEEQYAGQLTRDVTRLDLSASYDLSDRVSIVGNVSNLLGEPFNSYRYYNESQWFPRDLRIEGRYTSIGIRFKM
ncbi:TonB-dependent receptor [Asticcacaulis sp.]|uniref:TonB-dependent receptor n=1 Tax=Asticcacaulis sp. TaxID=1872648 RepID=UPI0031D58F3A